MSRKEDLEQLINDSYQLVCEYETKLKDVDNIKQKSLMTREKKEQWGLIDEYLTEYIVLWRQRAFKIPDLIQELVVIRGINLERPTYRKMRASGGNEISEIAQVNSESMGEDLQSVPIKVDFPAENQVTITDHIQTDSSETPNSYEHDVYISHNSADREWVERELLPRLTEAKISYKIDLTPGSYQINAREQAITKSRTTLLILTPDYLRDNWTNFESVLSQTDSLNRKQPRTIPILLSPCELPLRLNALVSVDLTRNDPYQWYRLIYALETFEVRKGKRVFPFQVLDQWLKALKGLSDKAASLSYNPFRYHFAEDEVNTCQDNHYLTRRELDLLWENKHTIIFSPDGHGKTTLRLLFERDCLFSLGSPAFALDYRIDFDQWILTRKRPTSSEHTESIIKQIESKIGISLVTKSSDYIDRLTNVVSLIKNRGYPQGLYILINNLNSRRELRDDPSLAFSMIQAIVETWDILKIPDLHFHLFLPANLSDFIQPSEMIHQEHLKWDDKMLREMINQRLESASKKQVMSLSELMQPDYQTDELERQLLQRAEGSPRKLIRSLDRLFQYRANLWYGNGQTQEKLGLRLEDTIIFQTRAAQ